MKKLMTLCPFPCRASARSSSGLQTSLLSPIWVVAFILTMGASVYSETPAPLVEFTFNDATNTGSLGGAGALVANSDKTPVLNASAGLCGGGALDLTSNTMGAPGCYFKMDDNNALDGMTSFTVAFWMKKTAAFGSASARMVCKRGDFWIDGWEVYSNDDAAPARLSGFIGDHKDYGIFTRDHKDYGTTNQWVFVAMTFDAKTSQTAFYVGTETTPVSLVAPGVNGMPKNPHADATAALTVGSSLYGTSAFQGYLDNVRVWGSKTESSAILSLAELETCRLNDTLPAKK